MLERPEHIKTLLSFKDKKMIKIVTGVRRCGKSTLFQLYQRELTRLGVGPEQIQNINLEELDNEPLRDYHALYEHIKKNLAPGKQNYIFLDEIQIVPEFGQVANSLYLKKNVDLYLTGSNSKIQSREIASKIERECVKIHVFPLSFKEYLTGWPPGSNTKSLDELFDDYVTYSSFPGVLDFRTSETSETPNAAPVYNDWDKPAVRAYLRDIYDNIVLKDIIENKKISDISRLESVMKFMFDNISKETSINDIASSMTGSGRKIDNKTLENYVDAFCDSFVLYKIGRYDIRGREILRSPNKYYLVDIGLRSMILGAKDIDRGKILENIVYLELMRRGYNVYIGKIRDKEVDFVAEGPDGTEYYQVADTVRAGDTLEREVASLESIKDHNPKYILTRDYETTSHNGIEVRNVLRWLKGTHP